MQFTIMDCYVPPLWETLLYLYLWMALPVGLPLVLWLRRNSRDAHDVLHVGA